MNMRSLLHHVVGIGSAVITAVLLYEAYAFQEREFAFILVIVAFVPGYFALRYLRGLRGWRPMSTIRNAVLGLLSLLAAALILILWFR